MALPRLPNTAARESDDLIGSRLDYFSRVSDLIQSDETRRQHRRPHRNDSRFACDAENFDRQCTASSASRNFELPSVGPSQKKADYGDMPPSFLATNGFHRREDPPAVQMMRPTKSSYGRDSMQRPTKSSYGRGVDLPTIPTPCQRGIDLPALPTPSHKSIAGNTLRAGPSSPRQRQSGACWRQGSNSPSDGFKDGFGLSSGQMQSRCGGLNHLEDQSHQRSNVGSLPTLGRHSSLPALQQQALGSGVATQRQTWNQASPSDSTVSTPDIPQPADSRSAKPWAPPWQPTLASDPQQSPDMIPTLPVPIRGLQSMPVANTRSASWQPGVAADTVLAPLGELPPVAEVSARSSEAYPSSLASADPVDKVSRDSSPMRSPVPGVGPPTPEAPPAVDGNTALVLGSALLDCPSNSCVTTTDLASPVVQSRPPPPLNLCQPQAVRSRSPLARGTANCSEPDFYHSSSSSQQPCARSAESALVMHASPQLHPHDLVMHGSPQFHPAASSQQHMPENVDWMRAAASQGAASRFEPSALTLSAPPALEALARGNDHPPRSPLRRKDVLQQTRSMAALPVLGALPSLSFGRRS